MFPRLCKPTFLIIKHANNSLSRPAPFGFSLIRENNHIIAWSKLKVCVHSRGYHQHELVLRSLWLYQGRLAPEESVSQPQQEDGRKYRTNSCCEYIKSHKPHPKTPRVIYEAICKNTVSIYLSWFLSLSLSDGATKSGWFSVGKGRCLLEVTSYRMDHDGNVKCTLLSLCSWLRDLNEYGICLLTNLPTEQGTIRKV